MHSNVQANQTKHFFKKGSGQNDVLQTSTIQSQRLEFIAALSQEFMMVKGYGVFAYLSTSDIIRLFEQFLQQGISFETFAKEYVRSFCIV